ncbi:MAG TPA: polymer-forming cytoskeletal protein [Syntrophorhabdales bacterium]|nr:polymer-forming cytoskeletal protein [Syntrophorhabdales bacterium]
MATMIPQALGNTEEKMTTVIADDLHIKGTITFATSLMIKGTLEGEIVSEGLLVVGPTAKIGARIVTRSLISHGEITGDVTASEQVVLKQTAVQTGNITTPYIVVENGSVFNGSCVMAREAVHTPEETPSEGTEIGGTGFSSEVTGGAGQAGGTQDEQRSFDSPQLGQGQANGPGEGSQPDAVMTTGETEGAPAAEGGSGSSEYAPDHSSEQRSGAEGPAQKSKDDGSSESPLRSKWRKKELF